MYTVTRHLCPLSLSEDYCVFFILDPYGRSPPFTPLGALGSGAFGGLGSPTLGQFYGFIVHKKKKLKQSVQNFLLMFL